MKIKLAKIMASIMMSASFVMVSCSTVPTLRSASEYLLVADKPTEQMLKDVRSKLEENKYKVEKLDSEVGLLVLAPRGFVFASEGVKTLAKQIVQLRQESGSVKLRIEYSCNYSHDKSSFEQCKANDTGFEDKVRRIEPALIKAIRDQLIKHPDQP